MTAPAIRAALDAAAEAARARMCAHDTCMADEVCVLAPCFCGRAAATAAVAAFLRMIPTGLPTADSPCHMRFVDDAAREAWSAAVEAAAEGGADG